jgi:hypothetical protein
VSFLELSLLKWARAAIKRDPFPVLRFPTSGVEVIKPSQILEYCGSGSEAQLAKYLVFGY